MSRTDHARKPRIRGHQTTVRPVRLYDGTVGYQSHCSCSLAGPVREVWQEASTDGGQHAREAWAGIAVSA